MWKFQHYRVLLGTPQATSSAALLGPWIGRFQGVRTRAEGGAKRCAKGVQEGSVLLGHSLALPLLRLDFHVEISALRPPQEHLASAIQRSAAGAKACPIFGGDPNLFAVTTELATCRGDVKALLA